MIFMSFFDTVRRVLGGDPNQPAPGPTPAKSAEGREDPTGAQPGDSKLYDRVKWEKKMKRILDELPDSQSEWGELMSEARALEFDEDWLTRMQVDEFILLIRRAVADRRVTEPEHRTLELARQLIGIPEAE